MFLKVNINAEPYNFKLCIMCVNIVGQYEKLAQLKYFNPSAVHEENVVK